MMKDDILHTKKLGYKFYFQDGDNQIACFGSFFTGKEEIYINDDLVSTKRSIGVKSEHKFEFAGNVYHVEYFMKNILSGRLQCSLVKNQQLIQVQEQVSLSILKDPKKALLFIGGCFLVGFLSGYVALALALALAAEG
jgi:hypothetical protein